MNFGIFFGDFQNFGWIWGFGEKFGGILGCVRRDFGDGFVRKIRGFGVNLGVEIFWEF